MKKAFVYAALCALALSAPATAERVFVPVLGTAAGDGSALATKVWVTDAEGKGILQPAAAREKVGLIALDADETQDVSAWMTGDKGLATEVPVFTDQEAYTAGVDVPLGDLPRPRAMTSLLVGAANLSAQTASCAATLYSRNGSRLAEISFEVAPLSFAREDVLNGTVKGRVAEVRVSCDQRFYPLGAATERGNLQVVFAKGIGPNGPCNYSVTLARQANGHYTAASPLGIFHNATRNDPKGIVCINTPQELRIAKATFTWDVTVGPWSAKDRSGLHNLAYFFLDRYRGGVVGNINAAGPNKSILKFMQNVGMPRGTNTNAKAGYLLQQDQTYRFVYTFDAANKVATLQTFIGGLQANTLSQAVRPGGQVLALRPYGKAEQGGLAMVAEFGNYNNQHHPEMPSWLWKFSNFKVDMVLK
jgi:hypothetical protein